MPNVSPLLKADVTFEIECVLPFHMSAFIPTPPTSLDLAAFLRCHDGHTHFVQKNFWRYHSSYQPLVEQGTHLMGSEIPIVQCGKEQRKEDGLQWHLAQFK